MNKKRTLIEDLGEEIKYNENAANDNVKLQLVKHYLGIKFCPIPFLWHYDDFAQPYPIYGIKKINIKPQTDRWVFPDGHGIIILADGRLMNLGCATGHPSFVMSNSFSNQVLAQISLYDPEMSAQYVAGQVFCLPRVLDEEVARLHLGALGAELSTLTKDQAEYINVSVEGPFKKTEYRY